MTAEPAERPFVDRPVGDPARATAAAARAVDHWALPEPVLARVGMSAIFTTGDVVLRVATPSAPAEAALALAALLDATGVRVARPARPDVVRHDGMSVTAWERLRPIAEPPDWAAVGAMVARIHDLERSELPSAYPVPPAASFPWWQFATLLGEVGDLLDAPARAGIDRAIKRHGWWTSRPADTVCHGDVHPGNVVSTERGPVLIDWDLLCVAPAGWDHAMLLRIERWGGDPSAYAAFADGYGRSLADDDVAIAIAELRLVAATLMRLRAGRGDPAALPEALRRLAYWRGDHDAPTWHAV